MEKIARIVSAGCLTNIKLLLQKIFGNHVRFVPLHLIAPSTSVWAWGEQSLISLGSHVYIRANTELRASNGHIEIDDNVFINRNCVICAREKIAIAQGVTIGPNTCIYDHDHDVNNRGSFVTAPVIIKENAWIGTGCIILKGVTIGRNAVVAAGSTVTKNVPDNAVLIQKRTSEFK